MGNWPPWPKLSVMLIRMLQPHRYSIIKKENFRKPRLAHHERHGENDLANGCSHHAYTSPADSIGCSHGLSCICITRNNSTAIGQFSEGQDRLGNLNAACSLLPLLWSCICIRVCSSFSLPKCNTSLFFQDPKMHLQTLISFGAIALTATAAPTPTSHVVHEKRESAPLNWQKYSRVDPSIVLPVRIGLTQSNLEKGPALLDEV